MSEIVDSSFVVATFNVRQMPAKDGPNHWDLRRDLLLETVRGLEADLLGTQEPFAAQVEAIAEALPEHECIGVGRDDGERAGEFAALFVRKSRFAVLSKDHFWLSETPDRPWTRSWDNSGCNRICTVALLEDRVTNAQLWVFNAHWDHEGERARQHSAGLLAQRQAELPEGAAVLIMGDFNCGPQSPAISYLTGRQEALSLDGANYPPSPHLRDAWVAAHPEQPNTGTFHGFSGEARENRIDYLLVSETVQVEGCEIVRTNRDGRYPSDHFPVVAHLGIRKN